MSFFSYDPDQPGVVEYDLQDAFAFGCDMCGECCDARDRVVVLSGPDVARVAEYLRLSREAFLIRYTVTLTDPSNGIPSAVLRPNAHGYGCVLQRSGKCGVHPVKPRACALYPLSRGIVLERQPESGKIISRCAKYVAAAGSFACGNAQKTVTVAEWLRESGVPLIDTDDLEWAALLATLTEERRLDPEKMDRVALYRRLYL